MVTAHWGQQASPLEHSLAPAVLIPPTILMRRRIPAERHACRLRICTGSRSDMHAPVPHYQLDVAAPRGKPGFCQRRGARLAVIVSSQARSATTSNRCQRPLSATLGLGRVRHAGLTTAARGGGWTRLWALSMAIASPPRSLHPPPPPLPRGIADCPLSSLLTPFDSVQGGEKASGRETIPHMRRGVPRWDDIPCGLGARSPPPTSLPPLKIFAKVASRA